MAAELLLANCDQVSLVDADDLPELRRWAWIQLGGYAVRQQRTPTGRVVLIHLHRWLLKARPGEVVDHDNRNTLDNRRSNLVLCSQSENIAKIPSAMPHGYRGVYPDGPSWRAQIKVRGKSKRLGTFPTAAAAARAYDVAALAAWGRFARLNFSGETPKQLALELPEPDPFDVPAPAPAPSRVDWYEIQAMRRASGFTGDRALAEALSAELEIPF